LSIREASDLLKGHSKISAKYLFSGTAVYIILTSYAIIVLFPMLWTIMSSFKTTQEFYTNVWSLPAAFNLGNYVKAWTTARIGSNILNSVLIVGVTVAATMTLASMVAYAVTRYKFPGSVAIGRVFMMGLFVPLVLGTIPTFFVLRNLLLYDTKIGLMLVYTAYSMPLSVFIMMGIFETMPYSFAEAAMIDGAGHFKIFTKVMLPLSRSGLVTISIFNFLWTWNDYIYAMIYLPSRRNRTLPVGMVQLTSTAMYQTDWGALFAGLVIVMLPSLLVYILFQKQIQKGLTEGGVKG